MAEALLGLLAGMTEGATRQPTADEPIAQEPYDSDGDGISNYLETRVEQTDPYDPDTDGDGLSDGDEILDIRTDPHDPDTDDDGASDGVERTAGTDPWDSDSDDDGVSDGEEIEAGTDPNDPDDSFAPLPGCGGWGACFSIDGGSTSVYVEEISLAPALEGLLTLPEGSRSILRRGSTAGVGSELGGDDLRSILGVAGDTLFVLVPAAQRVGVTLDRPLLAPPL
jgi:hypothetical protein